MYEEVSARMENLEKAYAQAEAEVSKKRALPVDVDTAVL